MYVHPTNNVTIVVQNVVATVDLSVKLNLETIALKAR